MSTEKKNTDKEWTNHKSGWNDNGAGGIKNAGQKKEDSAVPQNTNGDLPEDLKSDKEREQQYARATSTMS